MGGAAVPRNLRCSTERCDGDVVTQTVRECNDCKDIVLEHRATEADAAVAFATAQDNLKAAEVDVAKPFDRLDLAAVYAHLDAISRRDQAAHELAIHADRMLRASGRAAEHDAPHTHPVFHCVEHAPARYHEALANENRL